MKPKRIRTPGQVLDYLEKRLEGMGNLYLKEGMTVALLVGQVFHRELRAVRNLLRAQDAEEEGNALRRYIGTLEDQLDPQRPSESGDDDDEMVHILKEGSALCGFMEGFTTAEWPDNHKCVDEGDDIPNTVCDACEDLL